MQFNQFLSWGTCKEILFYYNPDVSSTDVQLQNVGSLMENNKIFVAISFWGYLSWYLWYPSMLYNRVLWSPVGQDSHSMEKSALQLIPGQWLFLQKGTATSKRSRINWKDSMDLLELGKFVFTWKMCVHLENVCWSSGPGDATRGRSSLTLGGFPAPHTQSQLDKRFRSHLPDLIHGNVCLQTDNVENVVIQMRGDRGKSSSQSAASSEEVEALISDLWSLISGDSDMTWRNGWSCVGVVYVGVLVCSTGCNRSLYSITIC